MSEEFDRVGFETQKQQSFLQVLFKVARLANDASIERVRERTGEERLRRSHTLLFPHLELDGIRLTDLAERLDVTKQAVAQLVDELVELGMLEKVPDPADGRAKLIKFTRAGLEEMQRGIGTLVDFEVEIAESVGRDRIAAAHQTLLDVLRHLES